MPMPLSELLLDVPLVETEAYVCRPKELREEEWTNRHDFPRRPRPMNVFFLYRRAVSERAKEYAGCRNYCTVIVGSNHQSCLLFSLLLQIYSVCVCVCVVYFRA